MQKALAAIMDYAVYLAKPEKVILFGSYATGKNNLYSDVDLLIITRHVYLRQELENDIAVFAKEFSLKANVLVHTPEEIDNAKKEPLSFLNIIRQGGKTVFEASIA